MNVANLPRNEDDMLFTMISAEGVRADLVNIDEKGLWEVLINHEDKYQVVVAATNDYHLAYMSEPGVRDLNAMEMRCIDRLIEEFRFANRS